MNALLGFSLGKTGQNNQALMVTGATKTGVTLASRGANGSWYGDDGRMLVIGI